jgi:hypothetical protein
MFTAFLDACVLLPVALGDTLLRAAEADLYRPAWSPRVQDEVRRAFTLVRPDLPPARIEARLRAADREFPDALTTGFEPIENGLALPDPDDRHVVAAAVAARADAVVTANLADFPDAVLGPLGLHAVGPDDFLLDLLDLAPGRMRGIVQEQAAATSRPALDVDDVLIALGRAGAPRFASEVRASRWEAATRRPVDDRRAAL